MHFAPRACIVYVHGACVHGLHLNSCGSCVLNNLISESNTKAGDRLSNDYICTATLRDIRSLG